MLGRGSTVGPRCVASALSWSGSSLRSVNAVVGRGSDVVPPPLNPVSLGGVRTVIRHPVKATGMVLGHKLEVLYGRRRPKTPPKIPKHPMLDIDQNMNEVLTYGDLKIRWQWTTKFNTRTLRIAGRWWPQPNVCPRPKPTCAFVWHREMPARKAMPELPEPGRAVDVSNAFVVFKSSVLHQHKVTVGDLVQCEKLHRREAGEKIVFGTVLMVGTKDFTIIGKPTVPYAKVKATVEQQTLTRECLSFKYLARKRQSRFLRRRQYITMIRIDEIVVEPGAETVDPPPPKPKRLLDLWANRWLDPVETADVEMLPGGDEGASPVPKVAEIYDGSEHQPGSYHRRGLTSCYRFWPDPQYTHWRW
mmetsp:Transcript_21922/g.62194  ORF Transcript_21922/g.62194 Transcript_21922/m.62194 type:complete len:360 (+) Transcript_21922:107-1186(+)